MATHVALLRGINVGKAKRIAMADLRSLCADLGWGGAKTLLNSGNLVFSARGTTRSLATKLEGAMVATLGVQARVMVLTGDEVATIIAENRLVSVADNPSRLLVSTTTVAGDLADLAPLAKTSWRPEALAVGSRAAYLWCPASILESPLATAAWRLLGDRVTSRNWTTMTKLAAMLGA